MSIGVVLALMAAVGYGTADFVGGITARRVSPWAVAFAGQLAGGLAMLAAGLCLPSHACPAYIAWALMAGPGFGVLFVALAQVPQAAGVLRTARHGDTSAFLLAGHGTDLAVVGVLTSLDPAVTVLLPATVLRGPFRSSQGLGPPVCGTSVGLVAMG